MQGYLSICEPQDIFNLFILQLKKLANKTFLCILAAKFKLP